MKQRCTILMIITLLLSAAFSTEVYANDTQRFIVDAGVNLGLWSAQVELFDTPSTDPTMISYATNAFNAITEVRNRLQAPFADIDLQSVLDEITRYPNSTVGLNAARRAIYVKNIYDLFRSRLSVLFLSTRGIYYSPNCDSAFLDVGYYLGRVQMGAFAENQFIRSSARSSLFNAIRNGLEASANIGCGFNIENTWGSLQIDRAATLADYQALVNPIRELAEEATQVFSDNSPISPSNPKPGAGADTDPSAPIVGTWKMGDNATVIFNPSGNLFIGTIHNVTSVYTSLGYREGMEYFKFSGGSQGVYTGQVIVRDSDGNFNWKNCRVTVSGDTATFSDLFDGGRVSYGAVRIR